MNAAKKALESSKSLFPQLDHQKRVIANSLKRQKVKRQPNDSDDDMDELNKDYKCSDGESRLPKQYQKRINIVSDASDISSSSLGEESSEDDTDSLTENNFNNNRKLDDDDVSIASYTTEVKLDSLEITTEPISSPDQSQNKSNENNQLEDVSSDLSDGEIKDSQDMM